MFMGSWLPTESGSYAAPGFDYQSFAFPTTGDHDSARVDFSGFMVPKNAKNADAAQKFAAFFLSKKYQDSWGKDSKVIPVREDAATSPELAGVQAAIKAATSYHQQNDGVAFPGYNEKVFWANSDKLFLGKASAQQFVEAMAKDQAAYWKSQGK
jgi:raffinose/stachyose/melibiose transport system substrate-binding protein